MTMAGAVMSTTPHVMTQNVQVWQHAVVHHVAQVAEPEVKVAPPRMGPRVR
jgi:hypothetical protein